MFFYQFCSLVRMVVWLQLAQEFRPDGLILFGCALCELNLRESIWAPVSALISTAA